MCMTAYIIAASFHGIYTRNSLSGIASGIEYLVLTPEMMRRIWPPLIALGRLS